MNDRAARNLVAAMTSAIALSCDRAPIVCTAIGCESSLVVEIQNAPAGPITVQVTPPGPPGPTHTATCPESIGCTNRVRFGAFGPGLTRFTVTTVAGTRTWELTPSYTTTQPNGRRCGPICRTAVVQIARR
jgi:hypothetical protein